MCIRDRGKGTRIQYNDKYVTPQELARYLADERARMAPEDRERMIVSLKGDLHTKMSVVQEVKQALRQANALKISYSASQKPAEQ